jgi:PAS domain-containing protein
MAQLFPALATTGNGSAKASEADSPIVQRDVELQMQRASAETEVTSERAERFADLLTLSYEPMLAWRLDGSIELWNVGAERLYGFALDEAVGRSSHSLLQTKFPIDFIELRSQLRNERYWSGELRHICKEATKSL